MEGKKTEGRMQMEDQSIIALFFERSENAIEETDKKYGKYLGVVAERILSSRELSEECVADTYLKVWNTIPPERPSILKAFLAKVTRNTALDRLDYERAGKRAREFDLVLEEISEAVPASLSDPADELALKSAINTFLASLKKRERIIFLQRYFYFCTVKEIASSLGVSESIVKTVCFRARAKLLLHLTKEGITL